MAAEPRLPAEVQANLNDLLAKLDAKGSDFLSTHFASLPRRLGRQALEPVEETFESVDWRSHRRCDLGALHLLRAARLDDEALFALFGAGDFEERRMILKALQCLPMSPVGTRLLQEAHRQNDQQLFEAGFADGDLAARVLDDDDYNRFVLKAAFIDLPLSRLLGATGRANPELSGMLLEFMSEREAAGRPVWSGSLELAAHAPCPGVVDRVRGELWHGDDARRSVAVRAAVVLASGPHRASIDDVIRLRAQRERRPALKAMLTQA